MVCPGVVLGGFGLCTQLQPQAASIHTHAYNLACSAVWRMKFAPATVTLQESSMLQCVAATDMGSCMLNVRPLTRDFKLCHVLGLNVVNKPLCCKQPASLSGCRAERAGLMGGLWCGCVAWERHLQQLLQRLLYQLKRAWITAAHRWGSAAVQA